MTVDIQFLADNRKNIANYPGILTLNPFINAKNITHALYQNMGDEVANPVDNDTVDDAPERVQRLLHCSLFPVNRIPIKPVCQTENYMAAASVISIHGLSFMYWIYSFPHASSADNTDLNFCPISLRLYSTLGGIC